MYYYPFPRTPEDFKKINKLEGILPLKGAKNFKKLPRYGFTGLTKNKNYIYCGSWNGIYQIDRKTYDLKKFLSNQLMSDLHGIFYYKGKIFHILTGKDTIVTSGLDGKIIDHFSIDNELNIFKNKNLEKVDWRFISKQHRGSTGYFHFNYISIKDYKIWLTSRNLNCFVVIDLKNMKAKLRIMNFSSVALIHDGFHFNKSIYLTSIDGKIIIVDKSGKSVEKNRGGPNRKKFNRDLVANMIDINHIIKAKTNWCRGIKVNNKKIFITIDGRYDSKLQFSTLELNRKNLKLIRKIDYQWKRLDSEKKLRYVTGFDILID